MEQKEAKSYLNKKIRIVLSNSYRFTGEVLEITPDTLVINDKFNKRVSLGLKDIISCEVLNG